MKKLLLIFSLLFLLIGLSACTMIGGNKVENNEMELTKEQQDIFALQIYNGNKGVESIKFLTFYGHTGATSSVQIELNGQPEDSAFTVLRYRYITSEYLTLRHVLSPSEWDEESQTNSFKGRYEWYSEANSPRETDPSKIKITYLDGSTNQ